MVRGGCYSALKNFEFWHEICHFSIMQANCLGEFFFQQFILEW